MNAGELLLRSALGGKQHRRGCRTTQAALAAARLLTTAELAARPVGYDSEFVGLCPLHQETRPSFYVNARKNLFYCHGCGQGGDLIRFVELSRHLSFRPSLAYPKQQSAPPLDSSTLPQCLMRRPHSIKSSSIATLRHCDILSDADCKYWDPICFKHPR